MAAMCAVRRDIWRGTANLKVTVDNLVVEAVGITKQVEQEQEASVLQVWATWTFCRGVQAGEDRVFQLM